jgi:hypothetical protein
MDWERVFFGLSMVIAGHRRLAHEETKVASRGGLKFNSRLPS